MSVFSLSDIPCWFWLLSIAVTLYQAIRGYRLQSLFGLGSAHQNAALKAANKPEVTISPGNRRFLFSMADCLTYGLCALSGAFALLVFYRVAESRSGADTPISHAALLIFLVVYGLLGVSGKLPDALNRFKMPSSE